MYNLTVDEAHTFYVGDGQWLVHNCADDIIKRFMYDGDFHEFPANKSLKLGYDSNLAKYKTRISGVDLINNDLFEEGVVSRNALERAAAVTSPEDWQILILDAMNNSKDINFIVDGMYIFKDPDYFSSVQRFTHWEMDQVIRRGYVNKLHLWEGGAKILDQSRLDWILQWKLIRGLW